MKQLFHRKQPMLGAWCSLASPTLINIIASAGYDFVILDMEHGYFGIETLESMIRACAVEECGCVVRTSTLDRQQVLTALDLGADTVLIPHIQNKEQAEKAVSYAKYHPLGTRGFSPFTPAGKYSYENRMHHCDKANAATSVGLIIEDKEGLDNLHEIVAVPHIDFVYLGAYDISLSLGIPGDLASPMLLETIQSALQTINGAGITAGSMAALNPSQVDHMLSMGMQFVTVLPDTCLIHEMYAGLQRHFATVAKG